MSVGAPVAVGAGVDAQRDQLGDADRQIRPVDHELGPGMPQPRPPPRRAAETPPCRAAHQNRLAPPCGGPCLSDGSRASTNRGRRAGASGAVWPGGLEGERRGPTGGGAGGAIRWRSGGMAAQTVTCTGTVDVRARDPSGSVETVDIRIGSCSGPRPRGGPGG